MRYGGRRAALQCTDAFPTPSPLVPIQAEHVVRARGHARLAQWRNHSAVNKIAQELARTKANVTRRRNTADFKCLIAKKGCFLGRALAL